MLNYDRNKKVKLDSRFFMKQLTFSPFQNTCINSKNDKIKLMSYFRPMEHVYRFAKDAKVDKKMESIISDPILYRYNHPAVFKVEIDFCI